MLTLDTKIFFYIVRILGIVHVLTLLVTVVYINIPDMTFSQF